MGRGVFINRGKCYCFFYDSFRTVWKGLIFVCKIVYLMNWGYPEGCAEKSKIMIFSSGLVEYDVL